MRLLAVLLLLAACLRAGEWSGVVIAIEGIDSQPPGADQEELAAYLAELDDRGTRLQSLLPTAPRAVQRLLREDLAFVQAEKERIGGRQKAETRYVIAGRQMRVDGGFGSIFIDREAGTAVLDLGGRLEPIELREQPMASEPVGEPVLDRGDAPGPLRAISLRAEGRTWQATYVVGLPNPWAMGLLRHVGEDDLAYALAGLPGLPWRASSDAGGVRRWLEARIRPGPVDAAAFAPGPPAR